MITTKKLLFVASLFFGCTIYAQNIVTDRPDQTESSSTIPKGSLQIEMGLVALTADDNSVTNFAGSSTLLRYGISEKIELRIFNQYESNKKGLEGGEVKVSGLSDLELGFKVQLFKKEGVNTEIAFLSHAIVPTAKSELSNNNLGTINKLSISHNMSESISLGYNVGYDYIEQISSFTYSAALGLSISKSFGGYIESYGAFFEGGFFESNFDIGFTYLLNPNFQLDVSYGAGLNNDMQYASTGFSWNIPRM
ncbi:MAG: hypothetical protein COC16_00495 [Lutibacter sp.]|nr:MAG: hypothetical protein COC16_00495 [Lutibacter sp.]